MNSIRQWAFGICAAAVACALAQLILPKSSLQRVFNVTCSVFFLACLLSPVVFSPLTLDLAAQDDIQREVQERAQRLEAAVRDDSEQRASESLRKAAGELLEDMGIDWYKIYINVHEDDEGGISISECELTLRESYVPRHAEIRQKLIDRLGVNVLIGYEKE